MQYAIANENNHFDSILATFSINYKWSTRSPSSCEETKIEYVRKLGITFRWKTEENDLVTMAISLGRMSLSRCPCNWCMWIWKIYHCKKCGKHMFYWGKNNSFYCQIKIYAVFICSFTRQNRPAFLADVNNECEHIVRILHTPKNHHRQYYHSSSHIPRPFRDWYLSFFCDFVQKLCVNFEKYLDFV